MIDRSFLAAAVVALWPAAADTIVRSFGVPAGRVHVIPTGAPAARFAPADREEQQAARRALGYPEEFFEVQIVQLVKVMKGGEEVRMSKRAGDFVTLRKLLDWVGTDAARYFFALDVDTGKRIWETRLGSMCCGYPVTYSVDGRQYVAVVAGYGRNSLAPEIDAVAGASECCSADTATAYAACGALVVACDELGNGVGAATGVASAPTTWRFDFAVSSTGYSSSFSTTSLVATFRDVSSPLLTGSGPYTVQGSLYANGVLLTSVTIACGL